MAVAPGAALLAASVAAERRAYRHGAARAAEGERLARTVPALVYGPAAGALWLLPDSPGPR